MHGWSSVLLLIMAGLSSAAAACFSLVSLGEGETRAARRSGLLAACLLLLFGISALLPGGFPTIVLGATAAAAAVLLVLLTLPIGRATAAARSPSGRTDERDIMFARARLRPGTREYSSYYALRPENRAGDDLTRSKPGLFSESSQAFNPFLFAAAQASSDLTQAVRDRAEGPAAAAKRRLPPGEMTAFVKGLAKYYGALDVGIARLEPYHIYSHIGRGAGEYGAPVELPHEYAVAFTVEMDFAMIGANPQAPGLMESLRQYVEAARVALQLAFILRRLGHGARAHVDGDYRVIAPLVARDAGLGEIGRMGLLMTPSHGPRVRLGVVTTDLELIPDGRRPSPAVIDFCTICNKCAVNCPSRSIPFGGREEVDGALRWKINAETCYRYWSIMGTDCGVCMTVCPYSHPATLLHNAVRRTIAHSGFARRAALRLDDFLYGRKPAVKLPPPWLRHVV
jgi:ferredoxin